MSARRFLALGDSYTIGEGVSPAERWPELLAARLREQGLELAPPQIIAQTGWTTAELEAQLEAHTLTPPYDLVTLLIGVNDQFRGYDSESYQTRFAGLLARAIELAGGDPSRTVVLSIPDYSVTPFAQRFDPPAIRSALERYNEINQLAALEMGVARIDVTPISREAEHDPELLVSDRLHPSAKMYREWAQQVLPVAELALRQGAL